MTKFRTNHKRSSRRGSSFMLRIVLFTGFLFFAFAGLWYAGQGFSSGQNFMSSPESLASYEDGKDRYYLPKGPSNLEVVHHKYYSLGYSEKHELPAWVAYTLSEHDLRLPNVKRAKNFKADYSVSTGSAFHKDYTHSGFTRGHMAPAGDMAHNKEAMQESFFMSNMVPQPRASNNGIWKELEETVRDWAYDNDKLIIISGPILSTVNKKIGKNKVGVPDQLYKIILDIEDPETKAIGFILPNKRSEKPLQDYTVTIDDIEQKTGLDFFADLMDEPLQSEIESKININDWEFSKKRYRLRVDKWNNE